ncbi:MAG: isoleucine--tRNA ligase [Spirochaetota bacterium]
MDYSKTVNLPETDFPMRGNLPQREPEMLKQWESDGIYNKIIESRKDAKPYIFHDGPPYANGHIHIGHALNKILKDMIVKHKSMQGFRAYFVPGWDCHGLPIELQVTKELGEEAKKLTKNEIRKKCRSYAEKFVGIQMEEFKRLGVFCDYENPYKTMAPAFESTIVKTFGDLFREGYIFKGKKPIYWCPTCETALAEAEVEYENHKSHSIYVKFKVVPETLSADGIDRDNTYVVIWTTTPWTLPANLAVSFHPEYEYSVFKSGDEYYILANGLAEAFASSTGKKLESSTPLAIEQMKAMTVKHPFIDRESKVIFGTHVTLEQGTGIVHTAPGHGMEDYIIGLEYGLDIFCPVDHQGRYTDEYPAMKGVHVFDANLKMLDVLKEKNALIHSDTLDHSYPHCWRCKKPLIYRATEQWFFGMDIKDLRKIGLKAVDEVKWVPSWGESRFRGMVETRPDWCLSRQRSWGVPIPSFICKKCGKNNMSAESIAFFAELSKSKGIDTWFSDDIKTLIPSGTKCTCGSDEFAKEFDILDVWFDSGVSHFAVLDNWPGHSWPADLYLEGSDQHRGWFQSSLWPAIALRGKAPYKTVLTHGFLLDQDGKAMSKSVGNVIPPENIIKQYGADILRLWVSSEDYRNDLRLGYDMLKQIADSYRKVRNTFKYMIGNLSDFDPVKNRVAYADLSDIDKWVLFKLYQLNREVLASYDNYEFHQVYRRIVNFCALDLSSIYFDMSKDILYTEGKDSKKRRANQTALYEIHSALERLIAPILSFTAEEVWKFTGHTDSIHMQTYYTLDDAYNNAEIGKKMDLLVDIKKDLLKALEIKRQEKTIGTSIEAAVTIFSASESVRMLLSESPEDTRRFLQVSKVTVAGAEEAGMEKYENASIRVEKATGKKCVRCWNYYDSIGSHKDHPELCDRCTAAVLEQEK